MELVINKQAILKNLKKGHWILDDSSPIIVENIKVNLISSNEHGILESNSIKNNVIAYYCRITNPLINMFYDSVNDQSFNKLVSDKIAKDCTINYFNLDEQEQIAAALDELKRIGTGYEHFIEDLSFIKINSQDFKSASNPHLVGAIVLTNQINYNNCFELSKSIIHELAHQELFLINFFDRLTLEKSDGVNAYSSYQKKDRPPIGRLHSLWALFRMIQYGQYINNPIENEFKLFQSTLQTLSGNIMTDFGTALIETIRDYIEYK